MGSITIGTIMTEQLNNPDCSFLSGMMMGNLFTVRYLMALIAIILIWKVVDKLAFDPLLNWIKSKFKKK